MVFSISSRVPGSVRDAVSAPPHLYADEDSRAELHVDSTALRLGARSSMSFMNLDDRLVQIRLEQGARVVETLSESYI
jgi:hypothetical protein